jgi:hypothetical protein
MKKLIFTFLLVITPFLAYSQNVKVSDYEVAVSKAKILRFNGSWDWSQSGTTVNSNNANGTLFFKTFYSSLPTAWFVDVSASGGKIFDDYNHNVRINSSFRKYIWDEEKAFAVSELSMSHLNTYKQVESNLKVGFGYGRYINATALAKAVRIEGHLLSDKVITSNLPKETMIAIANIIEREDEYKGIYEATYETYWLDDITDEIKRSGVLSGEGLESIGVLRMRQVLFNINERVNPRYYGWDVSSGIRFPLSTRDKSPVGNPMFSLAAEYSYPVNWNMQVNSNLKMDSPLDSAFFKKFELVLQVDFIYELSNRINFVTTYELVGDKPYDQSLIYNHNLSSSFWYYIENNIYFTVSAGYKKLGPNPKVLSTNVGLQYNLF